MSPDYIEGLRAAAREVCSFCKAGKVPIQVPCQVIRPKKAKDWNEPNHLVNSTMWAHPGDRPLDPWVCHASLIYKKYPAAVPTG